MMKGRSNLIAEDSAKRLRDRIEYIILFSTAGVSLIIASLDLIGLLDASSWVAQRVPALTLLCVGFVASYLIIERRGKLDHMTSLFEQRTEAILKAVGVEVVTYKSSSDLISAFAARIRRARRVDDVTWMEEEDPWDGWSAKDLDTYEYLQETVTEVSKKPDVIWREVAMFSPAGFKREKTRLLDPDTTPGYKVAYFDRPSSVTPPRIGFAVIDSREENAEVFLSSAKVRLKIRHPAVVDYFSQYFELIWSRAQKLKRGPNVDHNLLRELETQLDRGSPEPPRATL